MLALTLLTDRPDGLRLLKGVLANLMDDLGVEAAPEQAPDCAGPFDPQEAVVLRLDGALLGCAGVLSAEFARSLDLEGRPALMEVDFTVLSERCRLGRPYQPVPTYPASSRDLAIVVADEVLWADVERCVRSAAPESLESVELFDVYRGDPVPAGKKSVAFSMTFRRSDRTLKAEEAEAASQGVLQALQSELKAELR